MASAVKHHLSRRPLAAAIVIALLLASPVYRAPASADRHCVQSSEAECSDSPQAGPVLDVPAPFFWDRQAQRRVGGMASRFELDDPSTVQAMSTWYHVAYIIGGDRLRVYDHSLPGDRGPDSAIAKSQNVAWHVASVLDGTGGIAQPDEIPAWARPLTANINGPSAGLIFTLADIDLLTPGRLAGDLRVAGTGAIGSDGVVTAVRLVNVKLAAARLVGPDVFFAPDIPDGSGAVTVIVSHEGDPSPQRTIGDWLNTAGYEQAGRDAAAEPGTLQLVEVSDVRQALSWLCGRTQQTDTCTLAHTAAAASLRTARPYSPPTTTPRAPTIVRGVDRAE